MAIVAAGFALGQLSTYRTGILLFGAFFISRYRFSGVMRGWRGWASLLSVLYFQGELEDPHVLYGAQ